MHIQTHEKDIEQACMYVCHVTLVSQGQPLHGRPIMFDLLALVCRITKRGSLTRNLSQPCRHHNTVRHGYGSNDYGSVILTPFVAEKANEERRLCSLVTQIRSFQGLDD